jgi:putative ABC transport system ATP-binding protein
MADATAQPPVLSAVGLGRTFGTGSAAVRALDGVDLTVPVGRMVAVRGRSGSGKTTLLNLCGGLDRPDRGRVLLHRGRSGSDPAGADPAGTGTALDLATASERDLLRARREDLGFVFQSFGLLPLLTATENVGVPLRLLGVPAAEREARVAELLERVGLSRQGPQRAGEMSGGQQQRVAIARALAAHPRLLVADEPTGQLDSLTGAAVMALLREVVDTEGVSVVVATHDPVLAGMADEVVALSDGRRVA